MTHPSHETRMAPPCLTHLTPQDAEIAAALAQSEGTVRVAVHRLRKRFRAIFREEIAQTVSTPGEIEEEVRYLMGVLAG